MKAYLTSIGEKTTWIAKEQLERFGFEVVLLDDVEPWFRKYLKFINMANEDYQPCIRVDADIIVNEFIKIANDLPGSGISMAQFSNYDLYKNRVSLGQPVYYSPGALHVIAHNLGKIDEKRPETSAWRLPQINKDTRNIEQCVGMHGFFQDQETMIRAKMNKIQRNQMDDYDFDLVQKLIHLK